MALVVVWLCGCVAVSVGLLVLLVLCGSLVLSCCLSVSGGLVLSLVVFSGLVVSRYGSRSCVGLWVSGGLCVGLWCCVSGGLVWWSVCRAVGRW